MSTTTHLEIVSQTISRPWGAQSKITTKLLLSSSYRDAAKGVLARSCRTWLCVIAMRRGDRVSERGKIGISEWQVRTKKDGHDGYWRSAAWLENADWEAIKDVRCA